MVHSFQSLLSWWQLFGQYFIVNSQPQHFVQYFKHQNTNTANYCTLFFLICLPLKFSNITLAMRFYIYILLDMVYYRLSKKCLYKFTKILVLAIYLNFFFITVDFRLVSCSIYGLFSINISITLCIGNSYMCK